MLIDALQFGVEFATAFLATVLAIAMVNSRIMPRLGAVQSEARTRPHVSAVTAIGDSAQGPSARNMEAAHPDSAPMQTTPHVSILVPARDEAARIGPCVQSLLAQQGVDFELLVLDDESSDGTRQVVLRAGRGDARLDVIPGEPLPPGWLGKNWACSQLAQRARGRILVFTDADVRWSPLALRCLLAEIARADVVTVWPTQRTCTWAERLVVPLMALAVQGYLPVWLVNGTNWPLAAAANGQCLAFHRASYEALGGHAAVRGSVLEDVALAQRVKRQRMGLRMVDGAGLITCRMYTSWQEVLHGYAKNILAGHGDSVMLLLADTLFHLWVFVVPWIWLLGGWRWPWLAGWPTLPLLMIGLGVAARAVTARATGQRMVDALWMPISVLLMTRIALQAIWWRASGNSPQWKGRSIS